jgi:hypothetical protein
MRSQNGRDVGLKQFVAMTLLADRHTVGIGTQVHHFVLSAALAPWRKPLATHDPVD